MFERMSELVGVERDWNCLGAIRAVPVAAWAASAAPAPWRPTGRHARGSMPPPAVHGRGHAATPEVAPATLCVLLLVWMSVSVGVAAGTLRLLAVLTP